MESLVWPQAYDPLHHWWLSAVCAGLPLVTLLFALLGPKLKAHYSAVLGLASALLIAVGVFRMPLGLALRATGFGALYGLFPIFWIVFPVIFLYRLTVESGSFQLLQQSLVRVTEDSRLQLLLIAFALGAFFEGAAGFGTPVAVCATMLVGLGFPPLSAAGFALLGNTAPVAFGGLGIPILALHGVTGLDTFVLTKLVSGLITPFCILVPFWLVWSFAGFRKTVEIWPAILFTGVLFGTTQLLVARLHGPWLVDIVASVVTMAGLTLFLRVWNPTQILDARCLVIQPHSSTLVERAPGSVVKAALPWVVLAVFVSLWGTPRFSTWLDAASTTDIALAGLDQRVLRTAPVVSGSTPVPAVFHLNWLSATGSGIFLSAFVAALGMGLRPGQIARVFVQTCGATRFTLVTISALMGLGFLTRFCGLDATLGLAAARAGVFYPFFGVLIGWIGTASTGSDTSSNVLFGSLQQLTATQLGISPFLMAAANAGGGVMGKMIAPQSVVVASTATGTYGKDGLILRFVFLPSLCLACLMGILVFLVVHARWLARLVVG